MVFDHQVPRFCLFVSIALKCTAAVEEWWLEALGSCWSQSLNGISTVVSVDPTPRTWIEYNRSNVSDSQKHLPPPVVRLWVGVLCMTYTTNLTPDWTLSQQIQCIRLPKTPSSSSGQAVSGRAFDGLATNLTSEQQAKLSWIAVLSC